MKYSKMLLIVSAWGLFAGSALAADVSQATPRKPAPVRLAHPKFEDCHPGQGPMGGFGYGMGHGAGMMGDYGHGYGPGMMGGGYGASRGYGAGMMGGMGIKMLGPRTAIVMSLGLSDEQRARITKLTDKLQHDNWATMGTIIDDSGVLRDLYHADRRDSVAIDKTYQKIFDLKRQMIKAALDTENEIEDVLTQDQVKQLRDRLHQSQMGFPR